MTPETLCQVVVSRDSIGWRTFVILDFLSVVGSQEIIDGLAWRYGCRLDEVILSTTEEGGATKNGRHHSHVSSGQGVLLDTPHARRIHVHSDDVIAITGYLKELGADARICR